MFKFSKGPAVDFLAAYNQAGKSLSGLIPALARRRRRKKILFGLRLALYALAVILAIFIISLAPAVLLGRQIFNNSLAGKDLLEKSIFLSKKNEFAAASLAASQAGQYFDNALAQLRSVRETAVIKHTFLDREAENAVFLLSAASFLSQGVAEGGNFLKQINLLNARSTGLNYNQLSREERTKILVYLSESGRELGQLSLTLKQAGDNLAALRINRWLRPWQDKISFFAGQLKESSATLETFAPLSQALPWLLGYPNESNYLFVLQNQDELRPTGGFIGTFGLLRLVAGDLADISTHDIYHLDMPIKDEVKNSPPAPLAKYLNLEQWFLRDANWSPDWPTSARLIESFYQEEIRLLKKVRAKEKTKDPLIDQSPAVFSGVIGLTPKVITDLLSVIGPVAVGGQIYDQDNFTKLLEYQVEKGYVSLGLPAWERKEVIGDITRALKVEFFNLPPEKWAVAVNSIFQNIQQKNILIHVNNPDIQKLLAGSDLSGEIKKTAGDYLAVVDANLAALKTDAVVTRYLHYQLEENPNGLFAEVVANYAHHGDFDWRTTRYRTLTRVYVPAGSELISATGQTDGEVAASTELDKTVFSAFLSIEPGAVGVLRLKYKLPDRLAAAVKAGHYDFLVQKQPGVTGQEIDLVMNFLRPIKTGEPIGFGSGLTAPSSFHLNGGFVQDRIISLTF
ncbi:hypothetical protein COX22_04830 [Candidatus Falkowbacteria bacterium CG23_combo_of_CG06-09_8_20_14_all_49_15]|uniref:DUF4012 domain-containing protein n=1 Tax=Candidatus Falkowbacteria bacterium CG23_combo_of_CG06-09_8_20_14_all_49_15 TaxID=1974572 RepID=A0A2G9ZLX1_9BACT|nr:MAG: hypothetical protein COX22_04830 [Candidatus Falkowbacteria bacterium CG23_combo_of_CG06-09_8_20_14_all_49_15]